jgi:type IV pilus assembly protein PilW
LENQDHFTEKADIKVQRLNIKSISREVHRGYSLVELMVALTISLIILAGVASIFASSRSTYQTDEGLARLQENARFAMDFMNREVRMAGYFGCLRDSTKVYNNVSAGGGFPNNFTMPLQGFEYNGTGQGTTYSATAPNPNPSGIAVANWTPSLDASLQNRVIPGTDVIVIRHADNNNVIRLVPNYNDAAQVFLDPNPAFESGDSLIISDCSKASVFIATNRNADGSNVSHGAGNSCTSWGASNAPGCPPDPQQYRDGAELSKATTTVFYIGQGASGSPALYMTTTNGTNFRYLELAEAVENMQIVYGVDTDPPPAPLDFPNQYMTAAQVNALTLANPLTGWPRVMSVRVSLLIRTSNVSGQADQSVDTGTYLLSGAGVIVDPANDNRRRRVFTTTIQLRNRLPG